MDDDDNGRQPDPPSTTATTTTASKSIPPPPPRRLSNSTSALDSSSTTSPCIAHHKHYGSLHDYNNSSSDRPSSPPVVAASTATAGVLHSRDSSTDSIQWRAANGSGVFGLLNAAERDTEIKRLVFTAINDGNRPMLADFLATYPSATEVLQLLLTTTYPNLDLFYQLDEEVANDAAELLGPSMAHLNAIQIACVLNEEDIALDLLDFVARVTEEIESRKVLYEFMGRVWGNGNTVLHLASFQGMSALVKRLLELGAAGKKRNDRNYRPVDCADDQVTTAMFSLVVDDEYGEAAGAVEVREVDAADAQIDLATATVLDNTSDPPCRDDKDAAFSSAVTKGDQRVAEQEDGVLSIPPANDLTSSPDNDVLLHGEPRSPTSKSSPATTTASATAPLSPAPPLDLTTPIKLLAKQPRKSSLSNANPIKDGETTTLPLPPPSPQQARTKKSVAFSPETLLLNLCQHGAQTGDPQYLTSITTCLDILASHNIDINSVRTPQKALTPLHQACTYGHADIARLLLSRRICVNVYDSEGWTPLHCACAEGHVECVRLLGRCRGEEEGQDDAVDGDEVEGGEGFFYPLDGPVDLVPRNGDGETPEDIVLEDRADEIIAVLTDLKTRYPPPERTEPDGYELSDTGFGDSESLDSLASTPADVDDGDDARSAEDDTPDAEIAIDVDDKDRLNVKLTPLVLPWHGAANAGFATAGSDGKHAETLVVGDEPNLRVKVPETPSAAVFAVPPLQDAVAAPKVVTELVQRVSPEAASPGQVAESSSCVGESTPRVARVETAAPLDSRITNISEDTAADNQDQIKPPPARDFDHTKTLAAESSSLQQKQHAAASSPERRRRVVRPAQSSSRDSLTDQQQPPSTTTTPQSPTRIPAPPLSLSSPTRLSSEPSPPTTPLNRTTVSLIPVSTVSQSRGGSETDLAVEGGATRSDGTATQVMQSPDGKIISPTPPTTLPIRLPTGRRKDPPPKLRVAVGGGGPTGGASSAGVVATPITPRQTSDGGAANSVVTSSSSYSVSQPPRASSSIASSPADAVRPKLSRRGSLSVQTVVRGSPSTLTHEPHPPPASISSSALGPQSPAGSSTNNAVPTTPTTRSRLSRRFSITRAESVAVDVPFILRSDLAQQSSLQSSSPQQSQRQDPPIHRLYPIRPAGGSSPSSSSSSLSSSTPAPPTCTLVRTATLSAPFASGRTKSKHYHYATTTVLPPQAPSPPIAQSSSPSSSSSSLLSSPIPRAPPQPMWKRQSASPRHNNSSINNAAGGGLPRPPPPPPSLSEPLYAPDVPAGLVRKGSVRERAAAINSATAR
ncbi:hypothetical protein HDU89_005463 [Geranomyces variabilis]|nr:hypothetical protein HDU89_005463 [Geranomyces variabilis]